MCSKKLNVGANIGGRGLMPVDTLSPKKHDNSQSKLIRLSSDIDDSYCSDEKRKRFRPSNDYIPSRVHNSSVSDSVSKSPDIDTIKAKLGIRNSRVRHIINDSRNNPVIVQEEIDGQEEEFETLVGTPPLNKKPKRHNGLLFSSSPVESGNTKKLSSYKSISTLNLTGTFNIIDTQNRKHTKKHGILKFDNKSSRESSISLIPQDLGMKEFKINISDDCECLFFDMHTSSMGIVLKELKDIYNDGELDNRGYDGIYYSRLFFWMNSTSVGLDSHLNKIKNTINTLKEIDSLSISEFPTLRVVGTRSEIERRLQNIALNDYKNKITIPSKSSEIKNEATSSKLIYHFTSASNVSSKERTPVRPSFRRNEECSSNSGSPSLIISPLNFYGKSNSTERNKSLTSHRYSNIKDKFALLKDDRYSTENKSKKEKISNKYSAMQKDNHLVVEDRQVYEIPEKFSPNLVHKFKDGTVYTITNQDFKCLYNHDWINDTLIDFFIKFYVEKSTEAFITPENKIHIMSSFFYSKLISSPDSYYLNIKKWVSNSELYSKKFIVIPMNISFHWLACIIFNYDEVCNHLKSNNEHTDNQLTREIEASTVDILTFDSLSQKHTTEISPICDFLIAYTEDKCGLKLTRDMIKVKNCMVPQQPNMSDCGVHVISNIKKFFENPNETIKIWEQANVVDKPGYKIVNEYFEKSIRGRERKNLRRVLLGLQDEKLKQTENLRGEDKQSGNSENKITNDNTESNDSNDGDLEIIEHSRNEELGDTSLKYQQDLSSEPPSSDSENRVGKAVEETGSNEENNITFNGTHNDNQNTKVSIKLRTSDTKQNKMNYSLTQSPLPKVDIISNRNYLSSSPIKPNKTSSNDNTGHVSKYFPTSVHNKGEFLIANSHENSFSSSPYKSDSSTEGDEKKTSIEFRTHDNNLLFSERQSLSPVKISNKVYMNLLSPSSHESQYNHSPESNSNAFSSSSSPHVLISDDEHEQHIDVNLIGEITAIENTKNGASEIIRKRIESDLEESTMPISEENERLSIQNEGQQGDYLMRLNRNFFNNLKSKKRHKVILQNNDSQKDGEDDIQSISSEPTRRLNNEDIEVISDNDSP